MNRRDATLGVALIVLFALLATKGFVADPWGKDAYREWVHFGSGILPASFVVFGGLALWLDRREKRN